MSKLGETISLIVIILFVIVMVRWCNNPDKGLKSAVDFTWTGETTK